MGARLAFGLGGLALAGERRRRNPPLDPDAHSLAKDRTGSAAGSHSEPERPARDCSPVVMGCAGRRPHWSRLCSMAGLWRSLALILRAAKTNERSCWIIWLWFVG
jgi:hypothetical protein